MTEKVDDDRPDAKELDRLSRERQSSNICLVSIGGGAPPTAEPDEEIVEEEEKPRKKPTTDHRRPEPVGEAWERFKTN